VALGWIFENPVAITPPRRSRRPGFVPGARRWSGRSTDSSWLDHRAESTGRASSRLQTRPDRFHVFRLVVSRKRDALTAWTTHAGWFRQRPDTCLADGRPATL